MPRSCRSDELRGSDVGDLADAELQGGAVIGERRHVLADHLLRPCGRTRRVSVQGSIDLECEVDLVHRDLAVAKGVGHMGIDLGHDQAAAGSHPLDGGGEDVDLDPEGDVGPMGHRGVDKDRIDRPERVEQARYQGEAHREVLEGRVVAHARSDEGCLVDEAGAISASRAGR